MSVALSSPASELQSSLAGLTAELDRFRLDPAASAALREALLLVARAAASLPRSERASPEVSEVAAAAHDVWKAGYHSRRVPAEDIALARRLTASSWCGLLAGMLLAPRWQWTDAPGLDQVPEWLWGPYTEWTFVEPCAATTPVAADDHLRALEALAQDLLRWARRNRGSRCVDQALAIFENRLNCTSPLRSSLPLKTWTAAAAELLACALRWRRDPQADPFAFPVEGRALRVGVVLKDWGESLSVRALLPRLSALDPAQVTVQLFCESERHDAVEQSCRRWASKLTVLPAKADEAVAALRSSDQDVLVFGGPMNRRRDIYLGMHRMAPVQCVTDECPYGSGLSQIDLHLTAQAELGQEFSERLAVLAPPSLVWDAATARPEYLEISRAEAGLPPEGPVLACAASPEHLSPETLQAWAALLKEHPDASLLLLPPADADTFVLEQIFNQLQADQGLADGRIAVQLGDPRAAFALADVYLDTFPFSAPLPLLAALSAGLPAVAWQGPSHRSRTGAGILGALGLSAWVAHSAADYLRQARELVGSPERRQARKQALHAAMAAGGNLGDANYQSLHFGALLAEAHAVRSRGEPLPATLTLPPLRAPREQLLSEFETALAQDETDSALATARALLLAEPAEATGRSLIARALLAAGRAPEAVAWLLANLHGRETDALRWIELGAALRENGEHVQAISAYQAGLRLDRRNIDGWIALAEMARDKGADELAEDAAGMARRINPRDPRLTALSF